MNIIYQWNLLFTQSTYCSEEDTTADPFSITMFVGITIREKVSFNRAVIGKDISAFFVSVAASLSRYGV